MLSGIEISLPALRRNAEVLRNFVLPAKTAFVVKSNGYGHGLVQVGKAVAPLAHRLCVYSFEEAVSLRDGGVSAPILVMGPLEAEHLDEALARNVELTLWDTGTYLRKVAQAANRRRRPYAVHVKVNSGTARLGLEPHDACNAMEDYARMPEIEIAGVFSHLAAVEELDTEFTAAQVDAFERVLSASAHALARKGLRPLRHIAASGAAMLHPHARLDMVRIGIALYGLWPSQKVRRSMNGAPIDLAPALRFTAKLVAVRTVEAGASIGYGCSYRAPQRTRIGVLPIGYADGIPRALSNVGSFVVDGARCPIVGRVCMNMAMIDLHGAPHAAPGSLVTLIGTEGACGIAVDDWAAAAGTISYEIVSRLPAHLPRRFSC